MYTIFEKLLQDNEVTPYKVAKATGIATATLSDWKNGKSTPKTDKMQKIADYFGVTLDYLLGNEEKPTAKSDELENDPLVGQLFAAYGHVKEHFDQDDIDDITMFMEMVAERKKKKKEQNAK